MAREAKPMEPFFKGGGAAKHVLFADFSALKFNAVGDWLKREGVFGESITDPARFLERVAEKHFDLAVVNLLLGGFGPFDLIAQMRQRSRNPEIKIIVVSRQVHRMNIHNTIRAGANDFIAEPFQNEELYHRILYHLAPKQVIDPVGYEGSATEPKNWALIQVLLEATEILSRTDRGSAHSAFYNILRQIERLTHSNRTSLIIVGPESNAGLVLASSDDPNFFDFPISLDKYPEVLHVLHTGSFVLIEDVGQSALTSQIQESVRTIRIGSLMVFPVRFHNEVVGVLLIRRSNASGLPSMDVIRVLQALANTLAAHSNARALLRKIYRDYSTRNKTQVA